MEDLCPHFEPVRALLRENDWPGLVEGTSYGTPGLKVRGKFLARLREPDVLVMTCDFNEKEILMQMAPEVYFQTDHYKNWPGILIRVSKIDPEQLKLHIEKAWRTLATQKMIAEYESRG